VLNKDFAKQLRWQAEVGWSFELEEARAVYPNMQDLRTFLYTKPRAPEKGQVQLESR
jgi:hypothetical protein